MLGPSLSLGRIAGIPVRIHWTFALLFLWIAISNLSLGGNWDTALGGAGFLLVVFACVVLHELGHSLMAKRFGIETRHITLSPLGGLAALERAPRKWTHELWVALAGPAVNFVICLALIPFLLTATITRESFTQPFATLDGFVVKLFIANAMLGAFNLLPAFPMDGGRVFRALLASGGDRVRATRVAARTGQVLAMPMALVGLAVAPFLMLIAAFIFLAAEAELRSVQAEGELEGFLVEDAMRTGMVSLPESTPVLEAAHLIHQRNQPIVPLVRDGELVGVLSRDSIQQAAREGSPSSASGWFAERRIPRIDTDASLTTAVEMLARDGTSALLVFRGHQLMGYLDYPAISDHRDLPFAFSRSNPTQPKLPTAA